MALRTLDAAVPLPGATYLDVRYDGDREFFSLISTTASVALGVHPDPAFPRPPGLKPYRAPGGVAHATRGETPSGAGAAYSAQWDDAGLLRGFQRKTETILPTSGSAGFAGHYLGVIADASTDEYRGFVEGRVALATSFDNMTITGEIDQRVNTSGRSFVDVAILESAIGRNNGLFSGVIAGGQIIGVGAVDRATGTYEGTIVGTNGNEVVGGITVLHSAGDTAVFREVGSFIAY